MTKASFVATVGAQQGANGPYLITPPRAGDPTADSVAMTAVTADVAGNVTLVIDLAVVNSMNQLKAALQNINQRIAGTGLLTA